MGDRANVYVHEGTRTGVYLYSYNAWDLPEVVRVALTRGRNRWGDDQYLARIIFSQMIKDDVLGESNYGISSYCTDGASRVVDVDTGNQIIYLDADDGSLLWSFREYIKEPRSW
jgi:hypothetical protein